MSIPEDVAIQKQLTDIHVQEWLVEDVLRPRWWVLIALLLVIVVLWCLLVKKQRLLEIGLYTALAAVVFMGVNEYGEELTLWDYPTDIIAVFPPLSSINMFLQPFVFSLIYQYCTSRKAFILASLAASVLLSLVIDPILSAARMLELIRWKYYESIPVYFLASVVVRAGVLKIYKILEKHGVNKNIGMGQL